MNETLKAIHNRRSTRVYSEEPIATSERNEIIQAALRAPTAGNMMLYTIIEVEDQQIKERLVETCDHQPFIAKAPLVLLFAADYQRWFDYYRLREVREKCVELGESFRKPGEGDLLLACCDALIAAQNSVVAAESLGIGSCYIGDIIENCEIHQELFQLPPYVLPITMLCFGRPVHPYTEPSPVSRFDEPFIVHKNTYRRLNETDYDQMFGNLEGRFTGSPEKGFNFAQAQYFRKFNSDFSTEMTRSAREMIRRWVHGD